MALPYTPTTWVDNTTPINDDNLNKIEGGLADLSDLTQTGRLSTESIAGKLSKTEAVALYATFRSIDGTPLAGRHVVITVDPSTGEIDNITTEAI